jgi:hypothetical protein
MPFNKPTRGPTKARWEKFIKSEPMALVLGKKLIETISMDFLAVLNHPEAGVSTNVFLRILHNRAVDLAWIVQPVILKKAWAENSLWPSPQHHLRGAPEDSRGDSA